MMVSDNFALHIASSLDRLSDTMEENKSAIHVSGDLSNVDARDGIRLIVDAQNAREALRVVFCALREADKHDTVPHFVDEEDKGAFCQSAWDMRELIWDCFEEVDALAYLKG